MAQIFFPSFRFRYALCGLMVAALVLGGSFRRATTAEASFAPPGRAYGPLPLSFAVNRGQFDRRVRFHARAAGYGVFLTPTETVLAFRESALRLRWLNANPRAAVTGAEQLPGRANYFIGSDPRRWRTDVPNFARVRVRGLYPGVDAVYYGHQRQLEYDLIVQPGADLSRVRLAFDGAQKIEPDANGDLLLHTPAGVVRQHKPVAYQEIDGARREVAASYKVQDSKFKVQSSRLTAGQSAIRNPQSAIVSFALGDYDKTRPLVIDPVLTYATYLGGTDGDRTEDIAADAGGNAYVTGVTFSTNFPTVNALQATFNGGTGIAFVTKINAAGTAFMYSTYLGGVNGGNGNSQVNIAVDGAGQAYVAGDTVSNNFPTTPGAYVAARQAGSRSGYLAKLNAAGNALLYSTYVCSPTTFLFEGPGSGAEITGLAVDAAGNAYLTGYSGEPTFPTTPGAFHGPPNTVTCCQRDAFVMKFNAAGSNLVYSTFLGGATATTATFALALAIDGAGHAYVTGRTNSPAFPVTTGAFQTTLRQQDAFVAKINPTGTGLAYATYIGGQDNDEGRGIAVDAAGSAYITGSSVVFSSPIYPTTPNAFQPFSGDAYLTKFNLTGTALVYSTFLGNSDSRIGNDVAVDGGGNAYVVATGFNVYPVNAVQAANGGGFDALIYKFSADGMALHYGTYLGGGSGEGGTAIAVDPAGNIYVAGFTDSNNFPVTPNAPQAMNRGNTDGFVAKISPQPNECPAITVKPQPLPTPVSGQTYSQLFTASGGASPYIFERHPAYGPLPPGMTLSASGLFSGSWPDTLTRTFVVRATDARGCVGLRPFAFTPAAAPPADPTVQFSAAAFNVNENANSAAITVTRTGNAAQPASVEYATSDDFTFVDCHLASGKANQRCDYAIARGTLSFAAGETSKSFDLIVTNDNYVEGHETLLVALSNPAGNASIGALGAAVVTINDDDSAPPTTNPAETPSFFVRQHYADFLSRVPDQGGLDFWTGQITMCGMDLECVRRRRVDVSNAFFFELEFQQTGSYVYRLYRAAYGNAQPFPNPGPDTNPPGLIRPAHLPNYEVFVADRARVVGSPDLAQAQLALSNRFVQQSEFIARYPLTQTAAQFVDALLAVIQNDAGADLSSQRDALIALFNAGGRGAVLYRLADDNATNPINNRAFIDAEYNRAFVLTQYFGYLRRDPDLGGINFWFGLVNRFPLRSPPGQNAMVCAFITSAEYQLRFSSVTPRTNQECPPAP